MTRETETTAMLVERCPSCLSATVAVIEPGFFAVALERAAEIRPGWADSVEFHCRDCGLVWA